MKKIFIYYSLTGNGDEVGTYFKSKGYEVRKVMTSEGLPNNFVLRIITGGFKAMINYKDKLIDFDSDIRSYNEVVIGSPIWNSRLCSPINSVLEKLDLDGKKISFVLYSGSGEAEKAIEIINNSYKDAGIVCLKEPKKNSNELSKLLDI